MQLTRTHRHSNESSNSNRCTHIQTHTHTLSRISQIHARIQTFNPRPSMWVLYITQSYTILLSRNLFTLSNSPNTHLQHAGTISTHTHTQTLVINAFTPLHLVSLSAAKMESCCWWTGWSAEHKIASFFNYSKGVSCVYLAVSGAANGLDQSGLIECIFCETAFKITMALPTRALAQSAVEG